MCDLYVLNWGIKRLFYKNEFIDCIVFPKMISKTSLTKYLTYVLSFPSPCYQKMETKLRKGKASKLSIRSVK